MEQRYTPRDVQAVKDRLAREFPDIPVILSTESFQLYGEMIFKIIAGWSPLELQIYRDMIKFDLKTDKKVTSRTKMEQRIQKFNPKGKIIGDVREIFAKLQEINQNVVRKIDDNLQNGVPIWG